MKILHTSDWHLGHSLYGYDTSDDQQAMLDSIADICREEQPDLLLISGDIFDTARPGAGVQKVFVDTLHAWRDEFADMNIAVIAGNHDSASMHEIYSTPWERLGVHVVGEATPVAGKMAERATVIPGKCILVPIPYFSERFMPDGYIADTVSLAVADEESLPVIVMLHTTLSGSDFTGHERGINDNYIGGIAAISPDDIGEGYDYIALGHIHKPQNVTERIRYCGSPRRLSFDESFEHSVTIVEIDRHGELPKIRRVATDENTPLITLPGDDEYATAEELKIMVNDYPDDHVAYIRLNLKAGETLSPVHLSEIRAILERKKGRLCLVNRQNIEIEGEQQEQSMSIEKFKSVTPLDIASRYFAAKGNELTDSQKEMLREIIDQVNEDERS